MLILLAVGAGWDLHRAAEVGRAPRGGSPGGDSLAIPVEPVPAEVDSLGPGPPPKSSPAVDLNRASVAELDALPGIGPILARRIREHRDRHGPFGSVDELRAVPGIGPALLRRLRGLVRTDRPADKPEAGRADRKEPQGGLDPLFLSR